MFNMVICPTFSFYIFILAQEILQASYTLLQHSVYEWLKCANLLHKSFIISDVLEKKNLKLLM